MADEAAASWLEIQLKMLRLFAVVTLRGNRSRSGDQHRRVRNALFHAYDNDMQSGNRRIQTAKLCLTAIMGRADAEAVYRGACEAARASSPQESAAGSTSDAASVLESIQGLGVSTRTAAFGCDDHLLRREAMEKLHALHESLLASEPDDRDQLQQFLEREGVTEDDIFFLLALIAFSARYVLSLPAYRDDDNQAAAEEVIECVERHAGHLKRWVGGETQGGPAAEMPDRLPPVVDELGRAFASTAPFSSHLQYQFWMHLAADESLDSNAQSLVPDLQQFIESLESAKDSNMRNVKGSYALVPQIYRALREEVIKVQKESDPSLPTWFQGVVAALSAMPRTTGAALGLAT